MSKQTMGIARNNKKSKSVISRSLLSLLLTLSLLPTMSMSVFANDTPVQTKEAAVDDRFIEPVTNPENALIAAPDSDPEPISGVSAKGYEDALDQEEIADDPQPSGGLVADPDETFSVGKDEGVGELSVVADGKDGGEYYIDCPAPPILVRSAAGNPPAEIQGRFKLASWFYTDRYHQPQFPGSVTIYGQSVVSFGTNTAGTNGFMSCITPGAANWGDPANGNNRSGEVYATRVSTSPEMGTAKYKVDRVRPDKQPFTGTSGIQYLGNAWIIIQWNFNGYINIEKTSTLPEVVKGNSNYSMNGIAYHVFKTHTDALNRANVFKTIVLREAIQNDGSPIARGSVEAPLGAYYVREAGGGKGYELDPKIYSVEASSGGSAFKVKDKPIGDPIDMIVQKLDAKTGQAYTEDDPKGLKLAGAQFTIRYYSKYFDTAEAAIASGKPTRTWIVSTKEEGKAQLYNDYLVKGSDSLFYDSQGFVMLPLGTILIQETKAPDAYNLPSPNPINIQQIKLDPLNNVIRLNPMKVLETPHSLAFEKTDATTGEVLGGATFTLYKESAAGKGDWKAITTKTTDTNGRFTYSPIEVGSYKLVEIMAPTGYMLPAQAGLVPEYIFTIDGDTHTKTIKASNYKTKNIPIEKLDKDTHLPVQDTEFTIYAYPVELDDGTLITDISNITADDILWSEVTKITTDSNGKAVFESLPFGYYMIKESKPNPNYASYEESGGGDRFVKLDKYFTNEAQVFEDVAIQVAVEVYKKTIAVTSSGLDGSNLQAANNVGTEEYLYRFGARSNSNVWVDEFIITDDLSSVTSKGYRMTTLWTGTSPAGMDYDNKMILLYKTNMTPQNEQPVFANNPLDGNPYNPNNPSKNMSFSNQPGWRVWVEDLSTTHQTRLDITDLNLQKGEYIVGLKAVYGGVEKGFFSGSGWMDEPSPHTVKLRGATSNIASLEHWTYSVVATSGLLPIDEMGDETVLKGSVSADLAKNNGILKDNDVDSVETRVIEPFKIPTTSNGVVGDSFTSNGFAGDSPFRRAAYNLPKTGDSLMYLLAICAFALAGTTILLMSRRSLHASSKSHKTD